MEGTAVSGVVVEVVVVLLVELEPSVIVGSVWWPGFCHTDTSEGPIEGNSASRTANARAGGADDDAEPQGDHDQ